MDSSSSLSTLSSHEKTNPPSSFLMKLILVTPPIPKIPLVPTFKIFDFATWNEFRAMIKSFNHPSFEQVQHIIPIQTIST